MITGVTDTSLIAAAFGPGAVRRPYTTQPAPAGALDGLDRVAKSRWPSPSSDAVELSPDATGQAATTSKEVSSASDLTLEEQREVQELKRRDCEVRRHEQAHIASGGNHVQGRPSLQYKTGPDGKQYAVGGEVSVDTSAIHGDPEATIAKMQQVRRAALAPSDPSPQDRRIAAEAAAKEQQARAELAQKNNTAVAGNDEYAAAGFDAGPGGLTMPSGQDRSGDSDRPGTVLDMIA